MVSTMFSYSTMCSCVDLLSYTSASTTPYIPFFFLHDSPPTSTYPPSLHYALPIPAYPAEQGISLFIRDITPGKRAERQKMEEHTSELQSRPHLVCRLLLEKKKKYTKTCDLNISVDYESFVLDFG